MHHPHQFNVMARSFQEDKLRAANASRQAKKARQKRSLWQPRLPRWLSPASIKQAFGQAAANAGQLSSGVARLVYKDN
jgi:X-X-X-Leu-X-X-Gly heptad repeat protein